LLALDPHRAIHVVHEHDPRTLALQQHLEGAQFGQDFVAGKGVWMRQIALLRVRKHFHGENEKAPRAQYPVNFRQHPIGLGGVVEDVRTKHRIEEFAGKRDRLAETLAHVDSLRIPVNPFILVSERVDSEPLSWKKMAHRADPASDVEDLALLVERHQGENFIEIPVGAPVLAHLLAVFLEHRCLPVLPGEFEVVLVREAQPAPYPE